MLAACGDDEQGQGLLSAEQGLRAALDARRRWSRRSHDGDCDGAAAQAQTLEQQAADLPRRSRTPTCGDALGARAQRLQTLIERTAAPREPTGPTTPTGTTTETSPDEGTTGSDEQPGKKKEKKPKKDKDKGNDEQDNARRAADRRAGEPGDGRLRRTTAPEGSSRERGDPS